MILQILIYTPQVPFDSLENIYERCDSIKKVYDYFNPTEGKANPMNDVSLDHVTSTEKLK
jgi:hypothetical protein